MRNTNYNCLPPGTKPRDILHEVIETAVKTDEVSRLIKLVYKPDERTGLAQSELSVLVSDSVPQEIADWVRAQLLKPVGFGGTSSIVNGQQVDDDAIIALTRNLGEDDRSYIARADSYIKEHIVKPEES